MSLDKITIHWSAGQYKPNSDDIEHYHFMVCGDGSVKTGKYKPEDNLSTKDGTYAEHCKGANTGNIGIALCAMLGFSSKNKVGNFPITKQQLESCFKLVATLCKKYEIPISEVYTHMVIDQKVRNLEKYDNRKIDIVYLPCYPEFENQYEILDFIKGKIQWYLKKL